jgi:hypothetical protein
MPPKRTRKKYRYEQRTDRKYEDMPPGEGYDEDEDMNVKEIRKS